MVHLNLNQLDLYTIRKDVEWSANDDCLGDLCAVCSRGVKCKRDTRPFIYHMQLVW